MYSLLEVTITIVNKYKIENELFMKLARLIWEHVQVTISDQGLCIDPDIIPTIITWKMLQD